MKVYPVGDSDEYFYEGDALIEDRGQVSLTAPGNINYTSDLTLHEYIWLGGMPVAVVKTQLTAGFQRLPSTCWGRNDEADACGTLYPVSDYLPKVVAVVDSAGKLAGVGEYDVFGRVNEVAVRKDVPAAAPPAGSWMPFGTYTKNQSLVMAALRQPARTSSQRVKMRVNYAQVNTPGTGMSATDYTYVEAGGATVAPVFNQTFQYYYAGPMMAVTTNWFDVPANGQVNVWWTSGSTAPASRYSGATVRSYEYRRYEAGATPTWLPLRFPGQYADAETGLYENWNRFYDPSTGRYSASDPLVAAPQAGVVNIYGYGANNPVSFIDPSGLREFNKQELAAVKQAINRIDEVDGLKAARLRTLLADGKLQAFEQKEFEDKYGKLGSSDLTTLDEANALTAAGTVYVVNYNSAEGLDSTLVHELRHQQDSQPGLFPFAVPTPDLDVPDALTDPPTGFFEFLWGTVNRGYVDDANYRQRRSRVKESCNTDACKRAFAPIPSLPRAR